MNNDRLFKALRRAGMDVSYDPPMYRVRLANDIDCPVAEILLPEDLPVESKAFLQLARLAAVRHPDSGRITRVRATPDFHPGDSGVAIGSVIETEGLLIPQAVGTDINCGMRLHTTDIGLDIFLSKRDAFVARMKGEYFLGSRDIRLDWTTAQAMFSEGVPGFLSQIPNSCPVSLKMSSIKQLWDDADNIMLSGCCTGGIGWAPDGLAPNEGYVRDGGLATIGGGNHFVEMQVVDDVINAGLAWEWGIRKSNIVFMVHSGSRDVGKHVGVAFIDKVKAAWPKGVKWTSSGILAISEKMSPDLFDEYLVAEGTASNYAFVNRMLLAELLRLALRDLHGEVDAPLLYDAPHNITLKEGDRYVIRKGACMAYVDQPVIIPGSMGTPSFLCVGKGSDAMISSASHGAGRAQSRFAMSRDGAKKDEESLGLVGVDCVTMREERRIEEAPAAYKAIGPVIDAQVKAGVLSIVAKLRPVLTFKA